MVVTGNTVPVAAMTEMLSAEVTPGELDHGGSKMRRIVASVVRVGPPVSATFTLDGQPLQNVDLVEGVCPVELFVPAVERSRKVVLAMTVSDDGTFEVQIEAMAPRSVLLLRPDEM